MNVWEGMTIAGIIAGGTIAIIGVTEYFINKPRGTPTYIDLRKVTAIHLGVGGKWIEFKRVEPTDNQGSTPPCPCPEDTAGPPPKSTN